jgi:hypothetical protein
MKARLSLYLESSSGQHPKTSTFRMVRGITLSYALPELVADLELTNMTAWLFVIISSWLMIHPSAERNVSRQ